MHAVFYLEWFLLLRAVVYCCFINRDWKIRYCLQVLIELIIFETTFFYLGDIPISIVIHFQRFYENSFIVLIFIRQFNHLFEHLFRLTFFLFTLIFILL